MRLKRDIDRRGWRWNGIRRHQWRAFCNQVVRPAGRVEWIVADRLGGPAKAARELVSGERKVAFRQAPPSRRLPPVQLD